jgi:hypothetical protein
MEIAIPLVALSGLYLINKQTQNSNQKTLNKYENFKTQELPNTNIPNMNYPSEYPVNSPELQQTSSLSTNNKYDSPNTYTDKYFDPMVYQNNEASSNSSYTSMTGTPVDSSYFQHNNMVPFFGSNIRTRHVDNNSNESVLDNMGGAGSQSFSKKEQSPLFSPHDSLQWANGAPNVNDFYQSRVNVGMRMANVKPFEEEKVAPGLGLGFTTEGSGGFNSGMAMREQWTDRGVDELRVANKPKASGIGILGHEGPAYSRITNRGSIGNVEKNRPDTTYEMGQDRLFTTTGAEKGQMLHSIPIDRYVSRPETTVSYAGAAGYQTDGTYIPGEFMPSNNIELGAVPIGGANANGRYYANDGDYEMKAKRAYPNNRSENNQSDYYGIMGSAVGAVVAPLMDMLRPSRKENSVGNLRPYQNAKSSVNQSYIFNPADRPSTTIRETTENSKFHLNVGGKTHGAYEVTGHQAKETSKQSIANNYYGGNAGASDRSKQPRTYDAEYNQRNNDIKSSTIQGYMVQGNMDYLNNNVNMHAKPKDNYLKNTRAVNPSLPYQTPNADTYGHLQGTSPLYSGMQMDRSNPEILDALKQNPYALSVNKAFA